MVLGTQNILNILAVFYGFSSLVFAILCCRGNLLQRIFENDKTIVKSLLYMQNLSRETKIKSTRGKLCKALKIFAMALKFIKEHLLEAVAKLVDRYTYTNIFTVALGVIMKHLMEGVVNQFHS